MSEQESELVPTLRRGDAFLDFTLANTDGEQLSLSAALAAKPLILVFYRGDW